MRYPDLQTLIEDIELPVGLSLALAEGVMDRSRLMPQEELAIARAVPSRVAEFTGGRVAARRAMRNLGLNPMPIPMGPDRAPIWPMGTVGSISHTENMCIAMIARTQTHAMVGVDLELCTPIHDEMIAELAEPGELQQLDGLSVGSAAKRIFSAKEAVYKAIYPSLRRIVGFKALRVEFTSENEGRALPAGDLTGWTERPLEFVQHLTDTWIVSICAVPASP